MEERRRQLRREMDNYLTGRRRKEGGGWFSQKPQPLHPAIQPYKKEQQQVQEDDSQPQGPQGPMESEYEKSNKGWFSGFVGKLFGSEESPDVSQGEVSAQLAPTPEETLNDLKEVSRISLHVMRQMPGDAISEFKSTPDYERFKDILRKHKLIK